MNVDVEHRLTRGTTNVYANFETINASACTYKMPSIAVLALLSLPLGLQELPAANSLTYFYRCSCVMCEHELLAKNYIFND